MTKRDLTPTEQAAMRLWEAADSRKPCAPVRGLIGADNIACAYAVQELNIAKQVAAGARPVGRKIGMTSAAVQKQLGYHEPNYGTLFADREGTNGERIPGDGLLQPRAESEVAFVLRRDLDREELTMADVMRAVEYAVCAIEIIDSRIAGWDIRATDSIADNASCGMYVLGNKPRRINEVDMALCGMVSRLNGQISSVGVGGASLGHPLVALLWLARAVTAVGQPLKQGDIVLSGALGPIVPLSAGDLFETEIDGFGSVRVALSRDDG
ncbi:2-keto-4-pentenoate hydratase [Aidingimonas lacisalsi]|uniref:2-keto-4-pentenoate hydratase n=1 Tax=Aidingimonas lacisalsi TaxID=2604086 RepID=UPI00191C4C92|nr:fumarylacetoacetate hydrolase family protein [Aidingimonas lacisalsi]